MSVSSLTINDLHIRAMLLGFDIGYEEEFHTFGKFDETDWQEYYDADTLEPVDSDDLEERRLLVCARIIGARNYTCRVKTGDNI